MAGVACATSALAQDAVAPPHEPGVIGAAAGTGPYPAVAEVAASLPGNTLYHPQRLPKRPMPIVLWGNGGCRDNGLGNARFLREVASHGYLVIAAGHARAEVPMRAPAPPSTAPVAAAGAPGGPAPTTPDETQASQLTDGLDWAIRENGRRGSPWRGHLDTRAVAVMGHSCGGLQAIAVAADPRIRTAMVWNSGIYNRGPGSGRSGIRLTKDQLAKFHTPVAYINGGPADIAYVNALDDFQHIDHVPALFAWLPVGHGGTFYTEPNGGRYAAVAVEWLDWQLKRDARAARVFTGAKCGLCSRSNWTVQRKGIR
jgi:dienelactone hydrolase